MEMNEIFFYNPDKTIECSKCKTINYYTSYIHELGVMDVICPECLNKFINENILVAFINEDDNKF